MRGTPSVYTCTPGLARGRACVAGAGVRCAKRLLHLAGNKRIAWERWMTDKLEEVVGKLLLEKKLTLALGESCTGGLIGHRITNVAGSSEYFRGGVVAYAYDAK